MTIHHNTRKASFNRNAPDRHSAHAMGPLEFSRLGANKTVYIKSLKSAEGKLVGFGIYGVDGQRLAVQRSFDDAIITANLNDLEAEMIH